MNEAIDNLKLALAEVDDPWSMKNNHEKLDLLRDAAAMIINEYNAVSLYRQSGGQIAEVVVS